MSNEIAIQQQQLPAHITARGVNLAQWNTLCDSLYPGAKADSVLMVLDYCKARGLDPMKKPCHIVPISVKSGDGWSYRDVIMPGIYEYRITAHETGEYLGHSEPEYGSEVNAFGVMAPEWCRMVIKRWHKQSDREIEFPVTVYFREVVATKWDKEAKEHLANDRWRRAPIQMLTKCCEAAGLREAFPGQLGGTSTDDEMYGREIVNVTPVAQSGQSGSPDEGMQVAGSNPAGASTPKKRGKPKVEKPVAKATEPDSEPLDGDFTGPSPEPERIIKSQATVLEHRLTGKGIPVNEFCATFEIGAIAELPFDKMQEASKWIEEQ